MSRICAMSGDLLNRSRSVRPKRARRVRSVHTATRSDFSIASLWFGLSSAPFSTRVVTVFVLETTLLRLVCDDFVFHVDRTRGVGFSRPIDAEISSHQRPGYHARQRCQRNQASQR